MKLLCVVGTRPNFIKIAPLVHEMRKRKIDHMLIHTGQHYDKKMSQLFFSDLKIPKPEINLGVGSGGYGFQLGSIMMKLEPILKKEKPDILLVVGDVNSTLAAALTAKQMGIKVAHVEAGLRSFDETMPEEINRILTDKLSDYLFTTEKSGNENLIKERVNKEKIFFVGNVMIDTLLSHKERAAKSTILSTLKINKDKFALVTFHRPSNVDTKNKVHDLISLLETLQNNIKLVFPIHPRTKKKIESFSLFSSLDKFTNIIFTEPLGYLDFLCLMSNAKLILTDSGGIQEEATVLRIPCITFRETTERPITLEQGSNILVSTDMKKVIHTAQQVIENNHQKVKSIPDLWDGHASSRIVDILEKQNKTT